MFNLNYIQSVQFIVNVRGVLIVFNVYSTYSIYLDGSVESVYGMRFDSQ